MPTIVLESGSYMNITKRRDGIFLRHGTGELPRHVYFVANDGTCYEWQRRWEKEPDAAACRDFTAEAGWRRISLGKMVYEAYDELIRLAPHILVIDDRFQA